uniref:Uncharacterized protein n=1 Tax=Acidobacterium capsulatum TaxID=33075 RepID=A0A7V5CTY6_9BACT
MAMRCRHIKASGVQCNAYRVWKEDYCFFHLHHRRPAPPVIRNTEAPPPAQGPVTIPLLEDMTSVQLTVTQVLSALAAGKIDSRTAMAYIYGLRLAARNLASNALDPLTTVEAFVQYENGDLLGPLESSPEAAMAPPERDSALHAMSYLVRRLEYEQKLRYYLETGEDPPADLVPPEPPKSPSLLDMIKTNLQSKFEKGEVKAPRKAPENLVNELFAQSSRRAR